MENCWNYLMFFHTCTIGKMILPVVVRTELGVPKDVPITTNGHYVLNVFNYLFEKKYILKKRHKEADNIEEETGRHRDRVTQGER